MSQLPIDLGKDEENNKNHHPISSRETIYACLETPKTFEQLFEMLPDAAWAKPALHKRVLAMVRDRQLVIKEERIQRAQKTKLVTTQVVAKGADRFIYVDEIRLLLSDRHATGVFPNDEVTVRVPLQVSADSIPVVVAIQHAKQAMILCVVKFKRGKQQLIALDQRIKQPLVLCSEQYYEENTVLSVVRSQKQRSKRFIFVDVDSVLGDIHTNGLERVVAQSIYGLGESWDPNIRMPEAEQQRIDQVCASRESWVDKPLVTIDGEHAKDYDDAVYCEKTESGYRLYVAIADVAHYVKAGDELDLAARERGNSVYLPGHVIPMLPEVLSNQACSLLPRVNRLALGCVIDLDAQGYRTHVRLAKVAIKSHARLTYTQVEKMLAKAEKTPSWFVESLAALDEVAKTLRQRRVQEGTIVLRSTETQFGFDHNGHIESLKEVERLWAHQLIEECMLCANMAVGWLMHEKKVPIIYRAHNEPVREKVAPFQDYLRHHGIELPDEPTPGDLQKVLDLCQEKVDFRSIEMMVLRTLSQAYYSADEHYHFALSTDYYTHFTSPIRRYCDLVVHRRITSMLAGEAITEIDNDAIIAQQVSVKERQADEAAWFAQAWLKAKWMEQYIGKSFQATISSVTHFGLFVTLDDIPVEGLVHISMLGNDYYTFDESSLTLTGEDSNQIYGLGVAVNVTLKTVDLALGRIDFTICSQNT